MNQNPKFPKDLGQCVIHYTMIMLDTVQLTEIYLAYTIYKEAVLLVSSLDWYYYTDGPPMVSLL
jgi:hypothetical protein